MRIEWRLLLPALALCIVMSSHAFSAEPIRAARAHNPPPTERLDAFDRIEIRPVALDEDYSGNERSRKAAESVRRNFDKELQSWVATQNARAPRNDPPRVLVVEPRIDGVRLVSGAARFWLGPFMGSSRVLLRLRLVDAATGVVIAEPEFYQHARGMSGGFTLGVMDKAMLVRVAGLAADYIEKNTASLVGGPTGAEGAEMARTPPSAGSDMPNGATDVPLQARTQAQAASSVPAGTLAVELGYGSDPAQAARSLAAIHNCNGQFRPEGDNGFRAACWGGKVIQIDCDDGVCRIVH